MNFDFWLYLPAFTKNLIFAGLLLFICSFVLFSLKKKYSLTFLALSAFFIASAFACVLPWLNIWDEQFHALVGKNLSENPFHPKLIDLPSHLLRNKNWADKNTWLHKQPLFLYQIALSIKVFGNSAFAVRLPSVLLHVVGVCALYDMGRILRNKNVGFLAASLFLFSFYPLGLLSGRIGTDHNDSVFMVYVLLSFWAYFKYQVDPSKKWSFWIGIFAGLAILTKWVVGLLVFAPWILFTLILWNKVKAAQKSDLVRSILVSVLIALPWQIYIHFFFRKEAAFELKYNTQHFSQAIEGHSGPWFFHFDQLDYTFFAPILLTIFLIFSIFFYLKHKKLSLPYLSLWVAVFCVFCFFSIAKTKMISFIVPALPLILLLISYGVVRFIELIKHEIFRKTVFSVSMFLLIFTVFKGKRAANDFGLNPNHDAFGGRELYEKQLDFIRKNGSNNPKTVVMNAYLRGHGNISWMFFSKNKSISYISSKSSIEKMQKAGYNVKCISWNKALPTYILENKNIELIPFE